MPTYSTWISIAANSDSVWGVLSNVVAWPNWLPTVSRVEALHGAPLCRGARYRVVQPKLRALVWAVTRFEPSQRFVWEARSPGLLVTADHIVFQRPGRRSSVMLRVSFGGVLGPLMGFLFRAVTERYLVQEAAALKAAVEAAARPRQTMPPHPAYLH